MDIRIFIEPQQGATYEDQARFAIAVEAAGLDGLFRSDHYVAMGDHHREVGPTDTWITLGALARETSRLRLGSLLTAATFRYPGPLAIAVAQVDQMSNGRIEFGLGAGWFEREHLAYAIPFRSSPGERLARLAEQLEIVTGLWSTPPGSTYDFHGAYYEMIDSPALPKPHQSHLPIIVGGKGPRRTPALAARFADELNIPFAPIEVVRTSFLALEAACEERQRDVTEVVRSVALTAVIGEDESACERRASSIGRDLPDLRAVGLAGTPRQVAERLTAFAELGVHRVYLQLLDLGDLEQVALIGAELAPEIESL